MAKAKYHPRAKSGAAAIKRAEKIAEAMQCRRDGLTTRQTAAKIGKSYGWVCTEVAKWCETHPAEAAEQYRRYVIEREEGIIAEHWPNRLDHDSAKVIQASDKIIVDVLGLRAPSRTEITGADGSPLAITDVSPEAAARLVREAFPGGALKGDVR